MEPEAYHFRNEHRRRLAEHRRFRFNSSDAPAENAKGVDHRGVRIRSYHGIRIRLHPAAIWHRAHNARKIFQVYLVTNPSIRRHHLEIVERRLAPAQEGIALDVALKFQFGIQAKGVSVSEDVNLHGMID